MAALMYPLRDRAPVANLVTDGVFATRGALKPSDSLVDPIVVMCRIGLCFHTTDCGPGDTLLALIRQRHPFRLGSSQAWVTALSMMCRWTLVH
jgi:hypothetical protein